MLALHLERNNPMHQYMLGADQLESSFAKKDRGVLEDAKLTMNQPSAHISKWLVMVMTVLQQIPLKVLAQG